MRHVPRLTLADLLKGDHLDSLLDRYALDSFLEPYAPPGSESVN